MGESENDGFDSFEGQFSALTGAAVQLHELFRAYVSAGFTEDQSMQIVLTQIVAAARGYGGQG